jgi:hypothetical protein
MRRFDNRGAALLALTALGWLGGCQREHMSDNYGRQSRAFFSRQHVHATASSGSPSGLDSEESAIIKENYRHDLGAKDKAPDGLAGSRVLLVDEDDDSP